MISNTFRLITYIENVPYQVDIYVVMSYFEGLHEKIMLFEDVIIQSSTSLTFTPRHDINPRALEHNLEHSSVPEFSLYRITLIICFGSCLILYCYRVQFRRKSQRQVYRDFGSKMSPFR